MFKPHNIWDLLRYWQMDRLLPGVIRSLVETVRTFAAILADGSVVTWGDPLYGGDSTGVHDQPRSVRQIQASEGAFAAILSEGTVVTWGIPEHGGDSLAVQDQLCSVLKFAAHIRHLLRSLQMDRLLPGAT